MNSLKLNNVAKSMNDVAKQGHNILDNESQNHIISYIQSQQNSDGGFKGRDGRSDLYYTVFGLECMQAFNLTIDYEKL